MNIREHVEAGHYPTDAKGRALVPTRGGGTAVIALTDGPQDLFPIFGWSLETGIQRCWQAGGRNNLCAATSPLDLLPPPLRMVKITRYAVMALPISDNRCVQTFRNRAAADKEASYVDGRVVVEMTGEYEEPWS